ncbi:MAG: hypothetical protein ACRD4C_03965 [Candidatus Acidiferrales bacterium]
MNIRPTIRFSNRLSWRELDAEMWRLYFGFVKGTLMAVTSVLYFFVLITFFIVQQAVFLAGNFAGWVIDWTPEKPQAFEITPADGQDKSGSLVAPASEQLVIN